jgi:carbamoyltransferase
VNVLGLSCYFHDAAACLYRDGSLIAAAEEERFSRRKHDASFPTSAARYVLAEGGIDAGQIDQVVYYEKPVLKFHRILSTSADAFPGAIDHFTMAMQAQLKEKLWIPTQVRRHLGYRGEILYGEHHLSHAASAFFPSPFQQAAVLTADGVGEWATTMLAAGDGLDLVPLAEIRFPHSIGLLYSVFTAFMGFEVNDGEYKLMGMAAYGRPRFADRVRRVLQLLGDGSFRVDLRAVGYHRGGWPWTPRFVELFGAPCPPGAHENGVDERCADLASSIQAATEEALLALAQRVRALTGSTALCIAGGVGLNVLANQRIAREAGFDRVYVPPAPGDSGGAVGAAAFVVHSIHRLARPTLEMSPYLGPAYDDTMVEQALIATRAPYAALTADELPETVAERLARGEVVGWSQGRMEFGPRALGARSILADPRRHDMKEVVNSKIKFRESFRPFAPAVTAEDASRFFDMPGPSPYMSFTAPVRRPDLLPAVTHADGTARVQTVEQRANPLFHRLLRAFEKRSGVPVLLNTSFNIRGEPIVRTPEDSIACFARTEMDALAVGRFIVQRSDMASR